MLAQSPLAFAEAAENFRWRFFSLTRLFRHPTPARFWPSSCACACPRRHGCASWTLSQSDCPHQLDSLTSSLAPSRTERTFPPRQPCFPLSASVILSYVLSAQIPRTGVRQHGILSILPWRSRTASASSGDMAAFGVDNSAFVSAVANFTAYHQRCTGYVNPQAIVR
jgi:hypothetical protein